MELLIIPLFALARRLQGGWPVNTRRYQIVAVYAVLCAATFYGEPLWWAQALVMLAAVSYILLPGHKYVPASAAMNHYGNVLGYGYLIGERIGNKYNIQLSRDPERKFIDGHTCYGEFWLGGILATLFIAAKYAVLVALGA